MRYFRFLLRLVIMAYLFVGINTVGLTIAQSATTDNPSNEPYSIVRQVNRNSIDTSTIRGANYRGAGAADTTDYWLHYSASETERDLTYADLLKLNQLRVFVNYASLQADKIAFRRNLIDLARACSRHNIGLMITIGDTQSFIKEDRTINNEQISALVTELVTALGNEPALAF